jgi:hypothetical protein
MRALGMAVSQDVQDPTDEAPNYDHRRFEGKFASTLSPLRPKLFSQNVQPVHSTMLPSRCARPPGYEAGAGCGAGCGAERRRVYHHAHLRVGWKSVPYRCYHKMCNVHRSPHYGDRHSLKEGSQRAPT